MEGTPTEENNQFRLMLHGRILLRDRDGENSDVTQCDTWGLKKFAEDGELALSILKEMRGRLDLLFQAAEHRSQIDASLVRLIVEDIRSELQEGSEVMGYLFLMQMMFEHSEALPPLPTPDTENTGRSLALIKPAS